MAGAPLVSAGPSIWGIAGDGQPLGALVNLRDLREWSRPVAQVRPPQCPVHWAPLFYPTSPLTDHTFRWYVCFSLLYGRKTHRECPLLEGQNEQTILDQERQTVDNPSQCCSCMQTFELVTQPRQRIGHSITYGRARERASAHVNPVSQHAPPLSPSLQHTACSTIICDSVRSVESG